MALSTDENGRYVAANDSTGVQLTSIERQRQLLSAGYHFEAVVSQAAFVEAIALFYVKCLGSAVPQKEAQELESRLKKRQATFGSVALTIRSAPSVDSQLKDDLREYVEARNDLAHSMLASSTLVDLLKTFRTGERLIEAMKNPHSGYSAGIFVPYQGSKPA